VESRDICRVILFWQDSSYIDLGSYFNTNQVYSFDKFTEST